MGRRFDSYRLSKRAEKDLEEIYAYTVSRWSVDQANRYIADIGSAIVQLVDGAKVGRERPGIQQNYLCYPAGSHLIVYRATNLILVVRVLHQRMDVPSQLLP